MNTKVLKKLPLFSLSLLSSLLFAERAIYTNATIKIKTADGAVTFTSNYVQKEKVDDDLLVFFTDKDGTKYELLNSMELSSANALTQSYKLRVTAPGQSPTITSRIGKSGLFCSETQLCHDNPHDEILSVDFECAVAEARKVENIKDVEVDSSGSVTELKGEEYIAQWSYNNRSYSSETSKLFSDARSKKTLTQNLTVSEDGDTMITTQYDGRTYALLLQSGSRTFIEHQYYKADSEQTGSYYRNSLALDFVRGIGPIRTFEPLENDVAVVFEFGLWNDPLVEKLDGRVVVSLDKTTLKQVDVDDAKLGKKISFASVSGTEDEFKELYIKIDPIAKGDKFITDALSLTLTSVHRKGDEILATSAYSPRIISGQLSKIIGPTVNFDLGAVFKLTKKDVESDPFAPPGAQDPNDPFGPRPQPNQPAPPADPFAPGQPQTPRPPR